MLAPRALNTSGAKITFVGADTEKKISLSQDGSMFTVGAYGTSGIELTLGNNITLVGRTNGVNGADTNNYTNLVVVQYGASFKMLSGSKVTGNTASSKSIAYGDGASIYITGAGSSFKMQGGTVSGNTGGYGNADVFINANASGLTLSGNAHIGSLILCANEYTVHSSATIASGWTGSIGQLDLDSNITSTSQTILYWLHREVLKEAEGYAMTPSDIEKITLGNFLPEPQPISDTHYLYGTGQLFENGTVHTVKVSRDSGRNLGYPNLARALSIIRTFGLAGDYAITIIENQTVEPSNNGNNEGLLINTTGANILLAGEGGEKTVSIITRQSYMFSVNRSNVAFTLGNNIALIGLSPNNTEGPKSNSCGVIEVTNGASFTMLPGSKITGNSSNSSSYGAAVTVNASTFTMKGGEITGNAWAYNSAPKAGGVSLFNSSLIMEGGVISGNTAYNGIEADVLKNATSNITLSGDAHIGTLLMYSNGDDAVTPVTIASGWAGGEIKLDLNLNSTAIPPIINYWVNKSVLQPASGYTLEAADINKFTLGLWVSNSTATTQAIDAHEISDAGVIVPK
jgi:hypothetical protein